ANDVAEKIPGRWLIRAIGTGEAQTTIANRIFRLLSLSDGAKGLYLREIDGPILAAVNQSRKFEPASAMKTFVLAYALEKVQDSELLWNEDVPKYQESESSADHLPCDETTPALDATGSYSLSTALRSMMLKSNNYAAQSVLRHIEPDVRGFQH